MDRNRMDKFLLLVRRFLGATFRYISSKKWSESIAKQYLQVLEEIPLNARDLALPNGLRYHVIDIYIDELDKADDRKSGEIDLELMVDPIKQLSISSPTKTVRQRAKEALNDERLSTWNDPDDKSTNSDEEAEDEDEEVKD
jgi:ribosomal RNA-processing protein 1